MYFAAQNEHHQVPSGELLHLLAAVLTRMPDFHDQAAFHPGTK